MARIQIMVGSEMGTAESVAATAKDILDDAGFDAVVNPLPEVSDLTDSPDDIILICTSNTGAGDLPGSIQPLYLGLTREFPAIVGRHYGVINLGDSSYATFGEAGRAIDAAFEDVGAVRVGEPLVLDACSGDDPNEIVKAWLPTWVAQL
ncbi:flavodoxin domain-containing protein [Gilvimarinus sp. SDUM040013]|uniref:Flavodoxin domain-containing protein n=1 Tax=Gilvimarinus gilvus TaxID=3058038 RepID=A0ABU4RU71_9GAMM|nr:flavodoxin domain-containing protein [Gilvimarinus sp. SDUM040013]MDO3388186.1 flavodoxin domain-containing protein [Gilvimarinus sp. SDUM040013]MDX6847736.1 flavodoxin domain-containing protein [Gilvimarinus sp. SDUM040013]